MTDADRFNAVLNSTGTADGGDDAARFMAVLGNQIAQDEGPNLVSPERYQREHAPKMPEQETDVFARLATGQMPKSQPAQDRDLTKADIIKERIAENLKQKGMNVAQQHYENAADAYNFFAGIGRVTRWKGLEEMANRYSRVMQKKAEENQYDPKSDSEKLDKLIVKGAVGLLNPKLLAMKSPVGFGFVEGLSALGGVTQPGEEMTMGQAGEAAKRAVESGVTAKAFNLPGVSTARKAVALGAMGGIEGGPESAVTNAFFGILSGKSHFKNKVVDDWYARQIKNWQSADAQARTPDITPESLYRYAGAMDNSISRMKAKGLPTHDLNRLNQQIREQDEQERFDDILNGTQPKDMDAYRRRGFKNKMDVKADAEEPPIILGEQPEQAQPDLVVPESPYPTKKAGWVKTAEDLVEDRAYGQKWDGSEPTGMIENVEGIRNPRVGSQADVDAMSTIFGEPPVVERRKPVDHSRSLDEMHALREAFPWDDAKVSSLTVNGLLDNRVAILSARPDITPSQLNDLIIKKQADKLGSMRETTPAAEPITDTQAQVDAIRDPGSAKDAALITPKSEPVPTVGLITVPTDQGTFVTSNPEKARAVAEKGGELTTDETGALLDYTTRKSESDGTVVQAKDADSNVVHEEATNQANLDAATRNAERMAPEGGTVEVTDARAALDRREWDDIGYKEMTPEQKTQARKFFDPEDAHGPTSADWEVNRNTGDVRLSEYVPKPQRAPKTPQDEPQPSERPNARTEAKGGGGDDLAGGKEPSIRRGEIGDMMSSGEIVITSSSRPTTPFPKVSTGTERKTSGTLKRVDAWLRENALAEAEARGDEYNARMFRNSNPAKLSQADKDGMELYLFGDQPAVHPSIFKELNVHRESQPSATISATEQPSRPTAIPEPSMPQPKRSAPKTETVDEAIARGVKPKELPPATEEMAKAEEAIDREAVNLGATENAPLAAAPKKGEPVTFGMGLGGAQPHLDKLSKAIGEWKDKSKIPFVKHHREDQSIPHYDDQSWSAKTQSFYAIGKMMDNLGIKGARRGELISNLLRDLGIPGDTPIRDLSIGQKHMLKAFLENAQTDVYGKVVTSEASDYRGVTLDHKFVEGYTNVKDLPEALLGTLQLYRAADMIDPSGTLYKHTAIPYEEAYHAIRTELDTFKRSIRSLLPGVSQRSKLSAQIQDFAEGLIDISEIPPAWRDKAQRFAAWSRNQYDAMLPRINEARRMVGKEEVKPREDYFTHGRELGFLSTFFGGAEKIPNEVAKLSGVLHPTSPYFKYLKRLGGEYEADAIGNFQRYMENALRTVHYTPVMVEGKAYIRHLPPNAHKYFQAWSDEVLGGKKSSYDRVVEQFIPEQVVKGAGWVRRRMIKNILGGSVRMFVQQPSSFATTMAELSAGPARNLKDVAANISDAFMGHVAALTKDGQKILELSPEYRDRLYVEDINPDLLSKTEYALQYLNQHMDRHMVGGAFLGKYRQLIRQGMEHGEAIIESDKFAKRTQASYQTGMLPPVMRSEAIKSVLPMQTFTFNFMHHIGLDVTGMVKEHGVGQTMKHGLGLIASCAAVNALYQASGMRETWDWMSLVPGLGMVKYGPTGPLMLIRAALDYTMGDKELGDKSSRKLAEKVAWDILPPFGGEQIRKSIDGILTIRDPSRKPYHFKNDWERLMAVLFGPGSTESSIKYWERREHHWYDKYMNHEPSRSGNTRTSSSRTTYSRQSSTRSSTSR